MAVRKPWQHLEKDPQHGVSGEMVRDETEMKQQCYSLSPNKNSYLCLSEIFLLSVVEKWILIGLAYKKDFKKGCAIC